jgi:hypothetical protein
VEVFTDEIDMVEFKENKNENKEIGKYRCRHFHR